MNDSLVVWTIVTGLIVIAVILYCLWRLLTRTSSRGGGGITPPAGAPETRPARRSEGAATDGELEGLDLTDARGRARAAAAHRAEQREAATAAAPTSVARSASEVGALSDAPLPRTTSEVVGSVGGGRVSGSASPVETHEFDPGSFLAALDTTGPVGASTPGGDREEGTADGRH